MGDYIGPLSGKPDIYLKTDGRTNGRTDMGDYIGPLSGKPGVQN